MHHKTIKTEIDYLPLNAKWRVASDSIQWILQYGRKRGWTGIRFFRTKAALLRDISGLCGGVDPVSIQIINSWPEQR